TVSTTEAGTLAVSELWPPVTKEVVSVAIRPEKVKLSRRAPASDEAGSHAINRLEGGVADLNYLGGGAGYPGEAETGAVVRASMANTARLGVDAYLAGQRVVAWFTADDCLVLEQ